MCPTRAGSAPHRMRPHSDQPAAYVDRMTVIGIDIGGTGIKGAPVDVRRGGLTADRVRLLTPRSKKPADIIDVIADIVGRFDAPTSIGVTFPEVVREKKKLSWKKWAGAANQYLALVEELFSPDLIVIGGGIDRIQDKWLPLLKAHAPIKVATLGNNAGIVGAAMAAQRTAPKTS